MNIWVPVTNLVSIFIVTLSLTYPRESKQSGVLHLCDVQFCLNPHLLSSKL